MGGYFNTYNIYIYIHIKFLHVIINITINFTYKINLKNKTLYTGCPILNNTLRFPENYGRYGKMF